VLHSRDRMQDWKIATRVTAAVSSRERCCSYGSIKEGTEEIKIA